MAGGTQRWDRTLFKIVLKDEEPSVEHPMHEGRASVRGFLPEAQEW
jgi:hypothetical protein